MAHVKNVFLLLIDSLPDLANFLLAVVGVLMSLPKLAERIENNARQRKAIARTCIVLALAALLANGYQRRQSASVMQNLLTNTKTSVDQLKTVVDRTGNLVTNTNNTVTSLALLVPQMTAANTHLADLDVKINAAREKHDPRLIADLQAQAASARQLSDSISKDLLVALVPPIAQQLRNWIGEWRAADTEWGNRKFQAYENLRDKGASPKELQENDEMWTKEINSSREALQKKFEAIMANADSLRKLMLNIIPQSSWTDQDKAMGKGFRSREGFEGYMAADYLEQLAKRIQALQIH
jgi:hypothetical protein